MLTPEQEDALKYALEGHNLLITGVWHRKNVFYKNERLPSEMANLPKGDNANG
jgi:hypothetical protein